ncbi:hypothetical protein [Kribbella sp. CA-294648]|uniref:hypothetical protein n=1 Tax=Kribbella sp. CA-294648 TaxID=3239948 RepID=UPI003D94DA0A
MSSFLLAPVTVTPTMPLLPTHVKELLWVDVLHRSRRLVCDVTFHWNARLPNRTGRTVHFWEYLDRHFSQFDYAALSDADIGDLDVQFHADPAPQSYAAVRPYMERVENDGWIHPASRRMLDGREVLLVHDDGLTADYALLDRVLTALGATVSRLSLCRVPINGATQSSRRGGWDGVTLRILTDECLAAFDLETFRLGMRIYCIAILKRAASDSFRWDLVMRAMRRARRLIEVGARSDDLEQVLLRKRHLQKWVDPYRLQKWVDPYRLTDGLLMRRVRPSGELLRGIYL